MNEKQLLRHQFDRLMKKQFPQFPSGTSQYQMMWMGWIGGVIAVMVGLEDPALTIKGFLAAAVEEQDVIAEEWNSVKHN